jgi:hypothetical protein
VRAHEHRLYVALVCIDCKEIMASEEARRLEARLIRYVAPPMTATSDNLTSAMPTPITFDVTEERITR